MAVSRRLDRAPGWLAILVVVVVAAAPVAVVAWSLVDPSGGVWADLWATRLPGMITDTVTLLVTVLVGTLLLGTALAWVVTVHRFPGRRLIGWLLVTPLAIPGYVAGFVWLDTLSGPLGARGVRSIWVCAAAMVLTLYPYVYLFARAAFREQSADTLAAARSLGCSAPAAFWRVALPLARPALAAGGALVAMEVLTDVGTVRLFNVSTVADGVLRVWFGTGNRDAASELAVVLIGTAVALIALERGLRGRGRFTQGSATRRVGTQRSTPVATAGVMASCIAVLVVAVAVPVARLVGWAFEARRTGQTVSVAGDLAHHVVNTLRIAGIATVVCVVLGTALAVLVHHRGRVATVFGRVAALGYAVPGPVVAVGAVIALAAVDRRGLLPGGSLLVGSLAGLVYALAVRFFAVSYQGVEAGLLRVPGAAVASSRTLGARPWRVALRVELPMVRGALLAGPALVAIDTVKELPITLLLRPFGVDTLSVWVWQATSESLWVQAAVPSLAMVVVGMVAVGALLYALERGAEVVS